MPSWTSPEHHARLEGAAAGGREEGPASSGGHPEVPGLRAMRCCLGMARSRAGAQGNGCEQAPSAALLLSPGLHCVPSGQPEPHRGAARVLPPPLKQRERSCSETGMLEGRRLRRGGPWRAAPRQALELWQGSLTRRGRVPGPCGVPVPVEPSRATREPRSDGPHGRDMSHGSNRPAVTTGLAPQGRCQR